MSLKGGGDVYTANLIRILTEQNEHITILCHTHRASFLTKVIKVWICCYMIFFNGFLKKINKERVISVIYFKVYKTLKLLY